MIRRITLIIVILVIIVLMFIILSQKAEVHSMDALRLVASTAEFAPLRVYYST